MNPSTRSGLRVVHSSSGRLRVHVPGANDILSDRVGRLPGVTSATANPWSGNLLILFDPRQTTAQTLLEALGTSAAETNGHAEPAAAPLRSALVLLEPAPPVPPAGAAARPVGYVTGFRGRLYRFLGWASLGMAVVGIITPGIPGAPFVVLSSYFFLRSSPEMHARLLKSRWFGRMLRTWEEHRGISRSVKWSVLGLISLGFLFTLLVGLPVVVLVPILALEIVGLILVLRLRVVEPVGVAVTG